MVLQRIQEIAKMMSDNHDDKGIKVLLDAVNSALSYNDSVARMESTLRIKKFLLEPEDYRDMTMELDRHRRIAHDALLSSCTALNRYLKSAYTDKYPEGGIFGLPKEKLIDFDRHTAGDWAGELAHELFTNRQIRRDARVKDIHPLLKNDTSPGK